MHLTLFTHEITDFQRQQGFGFEFTKDNHEKVWAGTDVRLGSATPHEVAHKLRQLADDVETLGLPTPPCPNCHVMPDSFDTQRDLEALESDADQSMKGVGRLATIYSCSQCPHYEHDSPASKLGHWCNYKTPRSALEYAHTYTNPPDWCPLPFSKV